jgi:membrane protein implicated in regulation of membrane protease activity
MSARKPRSSASRTPSRREVLRPAELVGGSAILAVFTGLIMWMGSRSWIVAAVGFGVAFIVSLVVTALFVQSVKPKDDEIADLAEQDAAHGGSRPVLIDPPQKPADGEDRGPQGH